MICTGSLIASDILTSASPIPLSVSPNTGSTAGGTAITITGTGFVSPVTATLSGTPLTSVVVVNSTTITAVTPARAVGSATLRVTNTATGFYGDLSSAFTYAATSPTITSLNYSQGDIAGGGQAIIATGTNLSGATNVVIAGNSVAPSSSTATTCTFTLPAHYAASGFTVAVTTPSGTSNTLAFEYWSPVQVGSVDAYVDANKGVTAVSGAVGTWADQSANARSFTQATGANKPVQTAGVFGTLPSIRFTPQQFVSLASAVSLITNGTSCFAVAKWTATTAVVPPPGNGGNVPLTILGDRTSGYGAFGAKGGVIESNHYVGGPYLVDRGSGLNDGTARMIGATYNATASVITSIYVGATLQGAADTSGSAVVGANTYDSIGAGYAGDGWNGDLGAVVVVNGVIAGADLTKLNKWAQQRFGTP